MDGVETDEVGAPGGGILNQLAEIAEIADAPVVAAAQAVELDARAPHLATIGDGRLLVAGLGATMRRMVASGSSLPSSSRMSW